jgi:hypothetical protein
MLMPRILANWVKGNRDGRRSMTTTPKQIPLMSAAQKQQRRSDISYDSRCAGRLAMRRISREPYVQIVHEPRSTTMEEKSTNHGEGNPEAAAEFNKAEQEFVNSAKGKAKIGKGPNVRPEERQDLEQAEQRAKARGKNDDSNTTKMK